MSAINRVAKVYIYDKLFKGLPKTTDLKLVEETLRPIKDGEYLAELAYLSAGPNPKIFVYKSCGTGSTYTGTQVARIIESKNNNYPVGKYVVGDFGWRTLTIADDKAQENGLPLATVIPEIGDLPKSLALGVLGIPGVAAYFGLLEVCKPKEGDVVVISSAAGAVGSHAGQIAKMKGCKVIGITSSQEKGDWIVNELGFDHFINYKTENVQEKVAQYAPNGVDCYFDNVGGEVSSAVIYNLKPYARICICGAISLYYNDKEPVAAEVQTPIKIKLATMEGMQVTRWIDRWPDALKQNLQWVQEGKIKYRETVTEGFDNMLQALINTLQGRGMGKSIVHNPTH